MVYDLTAGLDASERYVVVPQLRRAAWSVLNNIAEGNAKLGHGEQRRAFDCSLGSLAELDAMIGTLVRMKTVEPAWEERFEGMRRSITAAIFKLLRNRH